MFSLPMFSLPMFSLPKPILRSLALTACACLTVAGPASAQDTAHSQFVSGVDFFERARLGPLDFSPVNIFYDRRCPDARLCTGPDTMAISVVLFGADGLSERVMQLGRPVRVPGGTLVLAGVGTPPGERGAIRLERYSLTFVFTPEAAARR